MPLFLRLVSLTALLALVGGCSLLTDTSVHRNDPTYPGRAATHVVELYRVQLVDGDMNENLLGKPLDLKVALWEDGREIPARTASVLSGSRGERTVEQPLVWIVDYDPAKCYQISVEEQALVSPARYWKVPKLPKLGYWPVAINGGRIYLGKQSYIEFRDKVEERKG